MTGISFLGGLLLATGILNLMQHPMDQQGWIAAIIGGTLLTCIAGLMDYFRNER